jgi:hypothetical protein
MVKFEAGKTYWTRSIGDHDCVFTIKVLRRTERTIFIRDTRGERALRVNAFAGVEQVKPFGTYSMCPIIRADKVSHAAEDEAEPTPDAPPPVVMNTRDLGLAIRDFIEGQAISRFTEDAGGELEEHEEAAVVASIDVSDPHNPVVTFENGQTMTIRIIAGA